MKKLLMLSVLVTAKGFLKVTTDCFSEGYEWQWTPEIPWLKSTSGNSVTIKILVILKTIEVNPQYIDSFIRCFYPKWIFSTFINVTKVLQFNNGFTPSVIKTLNDKAIELKWIYHTLSWSQLKYRVNSMLNFYGNHSLLLLFYYLTASLYHDCRDISLLSQMSISSLCFLFEHQM